MSWSVNAKGRVYQLYTDTDTMTGAVAKPCTLHLKDLIDHDENWTVTLRSRVGFPVILCHPVMFLNHTRADGLTFSEYGLIIDGWRLRKSKYIANNLKEKRVRGNRDRYIPCPETLKRRDVEKSFAEAQENAPDPQKSPKEMTYRNDDTGQRCEIIDDDSDDHRSDTDSSASSTGEAEMYFGEETEEEANEGTLERVGTPESEGTPERKFSGIKIEFKARVENSGNQLTEMLQARGILKTREDGTHAEHRFREDSSCGLTTL
ncbi:hypothetical protein Bbelb_196740 [Branchiostoma belcheri]|nr:hypothetical protein Bbelb_196740 [Branchiostoma belcheri]